MLLPSGEFAANGFEALAVFDRYELGGNGDGLITPEDLVWRDLLLWIDGNHNGISEAEEIRTLNQEGIVAIDLSYVERDDYDGSGNLHKFQGVFLKAIRGPLGTFVREQPIHDVFFVVERSD